jgi:hypothetical protein
LVLQSFRRLRKTREKTRSHREHGLSVIPTGATVKEFRDMIATVRDRIQKMINSGQNENHIVGQHATSDFDATWGRGRVQGNAFVREVYDALKEAK